MALFSHLLRENLFTPDEVPAFEAKLFFEGPRRRPYLERFGVLLFLATMIATMGILGDSTATVVGAMIVAPLMTPIMATTAALVTGRMDRALHSVTLVLVGVVSVIALAWLLGMLYTGELSFDSNSQITARIAPRVIDLIAALASGAAGAFCLSRADISDSLAGVAIAISLVPPLCVVGLSLSAGEVADAGGALLLFITNMLAILLAGGAVLATLGLPRAATVALRGSARRNAYLAIGLATAVITVPLATTGLRLNRHAREQQQVRLATERWLAATDFTVSMAQVNGNQISVTISGPGAAPPFALLVVEIEQLVGRPVAVDLEVVPTHKEHTPGTGVGG